MGFEQLYKKYSEKYPQLISEADMQPTVPAQDTMPAAQDPAAPAPPPPPPEPKPLTPEGKRYVIDIARKALLWPTDQIPDNIQSELAGNEVTPENAEDVLKLIERVVGAEVPRAAEE